MSKDIFDAFSDTLVDVFSESDGERAKQENNAGQKAGSSGDVIGLVVADTIGGPYRGGYRHAFLGERPGESIRDDSSEDRVSVRGERDWGSDGHHNSSSTAVSSSASEFSGSNGGIKPAELGGILQNKIVTGAATLAAIVLILPILARVLGGKEGSAGPVRGKVHCALYEHDVDLRFTDGGLAIIPVTKECPLRFTTRVVLNEGEFEARKFVEVQEFYDDGEVATYTDSDGHGTNWRLTGPGLNHKPPKGKKIRQIRFRNTGDYSADSSVEVNIVRYRRR